MRPAHETNPNYQGARLVPSPVLRLDASPTMARADLHNIPAPGNQDIPETPTIRPRRMDRKVPLCLTDYVGQAIQYGMRARFEVTEAGRDALAAP